MLKCDGGKQLKMTFLTMEELMPEKHFLRYLERCVDFSFIYDIVEPLYARVGRPSVDPVWLVKMLLLGYLYGIPSERKLEQEVRVNIAFRWFLGIDFDEPVPDHSTISQLRRRKFEGTSLFQDTLTPKTTRKAALCRARLPMHYCPLPIVTTTVWIRSSGTSSGVRCAVL